MFFSSDLHYIYRLTRLVKNEMVDHLKTKFEMYFIE